MNNSIVLNLIAEKSTIFVNENKVKNKFLDFSLESLAYLDSFIEKNKVKISASTHEVDKIASYLAHTCVSNNIGVVTLSDKGFLIKLKHYQTTQLDTHEYINSRISLNNTTICL